MGYTTDFSGSFQLSRRLTKKERDYLETFSNTRRMARNPQRLMELYKGKHGNPHPDDETPEGIYGPKGEYFAKDDGILGQNDDDSVLDHNSSDGSMPGLWCQWVPAGDSDEIEWDNGEKFYNYVEWIKWLIEHFFSQWKIKLNGTVNWYGEDREDTGRIIIKNNVVRTQSIVITYKDNEE